MSDLYRALARQTLAGIIAAPSHVAQHALDTLDPQDFTDWRDAEVFTALTHIEFADHTEPGSIITQVDRHFRSTGRYRNTDDGLQAHVLELVQTPGHPQQLPAFVSDLVEKRIRRDATNYALRVSQHAQAGTLDDLDAALREIQALRTTRARLQQKGAA